MKIFYENSSGFVQSYLFDEDTISVKADGCYMVHYNDPNNPDCILSYATPDTSTIVTNVDGSQFDLSGNNQYQYIDGAFSLIQVQP